VLQADPPPEKPLCEGGAECWRTPALVPFIQRLQPAERTSENLLAAHEQALGMLWSQLVPLTGHPAARAIFAQAIQATKRQHPLAGQAQALEAGLDFRALRAAASQVDLADLDTALAALASQVEQVIVGLVGAHLFLALLGEIELELLRRGAGPVA
jgi:hypothetical protein